ncbi:hypothetical protein [Brevibacillus porteri]|uniref:hypothetical protein n=2 Tax=Brevibacillus TaxID=55080 RepID=UPI001FC91E9E|nr:hypothetical protein [Brevibacillus porteri]MED2745537.1 hypothetical protein [Brevibacillus porteri]MED2815622.1 hypothetical protein [Brevibacillus porteri]MED2896399.1 hypothetical protein [Brevibacillus porteri]MED4899019.1 hypothetical protein [Brevibacillus porteri]
MKMPDSVHTRKGASKASLIPDNVLALLHAGELESVNLTEWQAVDHIHLVQSVLPHVYLSQLVDQLEETGDDWLRISDTKETKRIVTKAKRTILKTQTEQK